MPPPRTTSSGSSRQLTAAMASQISDGASAVLLASEQAVKDHKLTPRARIHHISARGADPVFMLTGPIPATRYALDKAGLFERLPVVSLGEEDVFHRSPISDIGDDHPHQIARARVSVLRKLTGSERGPLVSVHGRVGGQAHERP